jgi:hypothetical protein
VVTGPRNISNAEDVTPNRFNSRATRHAETQDIVTRVLDGTMLEGLTRFGPELSRVVPLVGRQVNKYLTLEELDLLRGDLLLDGSGSLEVDGVVSQVELTSDLEELSSGVLVTDQGGYVSEVVVAKLLAAMLDRTRKGSVGSDFNQGINKKVVRGSKSLDSLVEQHGADQILAPVVLVDNGTLRESGVGDTGNHDGTSGQGGAE